MLSLFILNVIGIAVYLGLGIVAVLLFILSGAGSFLLKNGLQGITANLPNILSSFLIPLISISTIFMILFIIVSAVLNISSILLVDSQGHKSLGDVIKKSFGLIIPLFLVGVLTFILSFGALFVLILPVILFAYLLTFTQLEVVLNNQRWLTAIKRSVTIVSKNFGGILVRWLLMTVIYVVIVSIIPNLLYKLGSEIQIIVGIFSFIVNLLLGWYMLAYQVVLYKQAKATVGSGETKSIAWMWVIAVIGWLIAIGISFAGYKAISSGILNSLLKQSSSIAPGTSIQRSVDQMKPGAVVYYNKSTELFKQMREVQQGSGKSDAQIIAETKKLNDENITLLKKALEIDPNNPKLWYELGNANTWISSAGKLEDGLVAYQKAEELDPNNVIYINGVGDMLIQMGKYEDAVLHFQKTLRLTNDSGFANLSLARAYNHLKIYDSAREHYNKAITIFTSENKEGNYDDEILLARKELAGLPK